MADHDFNRHNHPHETDTHIRVEKRRRPNWLWLLVPLILGLLVLPNLFDRDDDRVGDRRVGPTVERDARVAAVTYDGQTWQPRGAAQDIRADEMTAIGRSAEGHALFRRAGGGGGAAGHTQVYMRTSDGLFQPLARVGETTDRNKVENPNR